MADVVLGCHRGRLTNLLSQSELDTLASRLTPDHLAPKAATRIISGDLVIGLLNPDDTVHQQDGSAMIGQLYGLDSGWAVPGGPVSQSTFALMRSNADTVELQTSITGQRALFYVQTDEVFYASTSQRALAFLLGEHRLNRSTVPWMLSCGNLGPFLCWDERVKMLWPDTRVQLDRQTWRVQETTQPVIYQEVKRSRQDHINGLFEVIRDSVGRLDIDWERWRMPLSGGRDSRALLMLFAQAGHKIPCLTWGRADAPNVPGGDAQIAAQVAQYYGMSHVFHNIEDSQEPATTILSRFVRNSEGRVDAICGYLDGFRLWRGLAEQGAAGVIRGDEAFGYRIVRNERGVVFTDRFERLADLAGQPKSEEIGLPPQVWPEPLQRRAGESLEAWRCRLYSAWRAPVVHSGLNRLASHYVGICSPYMARPIIEFIRTMPDDLRNEKTAFCATVDKLCAPHIPFAESRQALPEIQVVLSRPDLLATIREGLMSTDATAALSDEAVELALQRIKPAGSRKRTLHQQLRTLGRRFLSMKAQRLLQNYVMRWGLDSNTFAFRAYIATTAYTLYQEDAKAGREARERTLQSADAHDPPKAEQ